MNNIKLVVIDCDGVLYHPSELDINAMAFCAFDGACTALSIPADKPEFLEACKQPNFFTYIDNTAKKHGIKTDDFVSHMLASIDYSGLKPDNTGLLQKINDLSDKYKFCICTNNHLRHVNNILNAKFSISCEQLPFEIFDTRYAYLDGIYYSKQSDVFISKLEKHFGIDVKDFLWIDDSPDVIARVKSIGSNGALVTDDNRLIDILNTL